MKFQNLFKQSLQIEAENIYKEILEIKNLILKTENKLIISDFSKIGKSLANDAIRKWYKLARIANWSKATLKNVIKELQEDESFFKNLISRKGNKKTSIGVIVDIETTGLHIEQNQIIEIGAIKFNTENFEEIDRFSTLIYSNQKVPRFISELTGLKTIDLQEKGIPENEALKKLINFCGDSNIYAHNAIFDQKFIRYALERNNCSYSVTNWLDTIDIFKKKWPGRNTYKLSSLSGDFCIFNTSHRALGDALSVLQLLQK